MRRLFLASNILTIFTLVVLFFLLGLLFTKSGTCPVIQGDSAKTGNKGNASQLLRVLDPTKVEDHLPLLIFEATDKSYPR